MILFCHLERHFVVYVKKGLLKQTSAEVSIFILSSEKSIKPKKSMKIFSTISIDENYCVNENAGKF